MYEVIMPKLEANTHEAMLLKWLKSEGESVKKGEPLFLIETVKATIEVEAEINGVLNKIIVKEGMQVPILTVVAQIEEK